MTRFRRLTRDDLATLTRDQLLPRLEAEQEYWASTYWDQTPGLEDEK